MLQVWETSFLGLLGSFVKYSESKCDTAQGKDASRRNFLMHYAEY